MLKKAIGGALALILLCCLSIYVYLASKITERPDQALQTKSNIHDPSYHSQAARADEWLKLLYENHMLPSLSAAVGIGGKLVWNGTIGYADLDKEAVADAQSKYRIGSISKPITAVALMRLVEKEKIRLDAPFNHYVDDYAQGRSSYTIEQLVAHQSGIRHYPKDIYGTFENLRNIEYRTTREAAAIIENDTPLFSPGEGFQYSTYAYTVLAMTMETAAGLPFGEIMSTEVFSPLNLSNTSLGTKDFKDQAQAYIYVQDTLVRAPEVNLSYKYAGGGLVSTPSDLVLFGNALLSDQILSEQTKKRLWTPVPLNNGDMNPQNYALGFRVGEDELGIKYHHGGISVGGYSFFVIYPEQELVIALVSNVTPMAPVFNREDEAKQLAKIFFP